MSRNSPTIVLTPQDPAFPETELADNPFPSPDGADMEYQPGAPMMTVRIKARVRNITAGKPLRYDLPDEE